MMTRQEAVLKGFPDNPEIPDTFYAALRIPHLESGALYAIENTKEKILKVEHKILECYKQGKTPDNLERMLFCLKIYLGLYQGYYDNVYNK